VDPLLAPGASTGSAMRPGRNGGSGRHLGEVVLIELSAHGEGGRVQRLSPAPALVSWPFQGRQLGPPCRYWSQAAMTVPRLVISAATMTPNALL